MITHIAASFREIANTDVQILTEFKLWRFDSGLLRDVAPYHILYEVLALHLSDVKALGIVISHMLLLCASRMEY